MNNDYISKTGHTCEIAPEMDQVFPYIPDGIFARFRRYFRRSCTISNKNPFGRHFFKSSAAINFERSRHLSTYYYVIHPFSNFRRFWEAYMIVVFMCYFFISPFMFAFYYLTKKKLHTFLLFLDWFLDLSCFIDIGMNFNTGYYDRDRREVVLDYKRIARRYASTFLFFDFVSSVPLTTILSELNVHSTHNIHIYFTVLKIVRLLSVYLYLQRTAESLFLSDIPVKLFFGTSLAMLFIHWGACFHFAVAFLTNCSDTWLKFDTPNVVPLYKVYTVCVFRIASTIMAVDYSVGVTRNSLTRLYSILVGVIGKVLFTYATVEVIRWTIFINASSSKYQQMMDQVQIYMSHKKLPLFLQRRILQYYEFRFQKSYFQEKEILKALNGQLRQEITLFSCRRLVENVTFFNNLPATLLVNIVACLRAEIFLVNDVIVKAGAIGYSMYFITSGTVAVYTAMGKEVCHLEDGSHFGEVALVMEDERRIASVVAVESCEIYRLDRTDFLRAVAPYPDLLSRIERIAEDRLEKTMQLDDHTRRSFKTFRGSIYAR